MTIPFREKYHHKYCEDSEKRILKIKNISKGCRSSFETLKKEVRRIHPSKMDAISKNIFSKILIPKNNTIEKVF